MLKNIILFMIMSILTTMSFANNNVNATPFKILNGALPVIADVTNFAYNCVSMEDGSTVYDVIPNAYSNSGSMYVTVYCSLTKSKILLPLSQQENVITTPVASYSVKFNGPVSASCEAITKLIVEKSADFPYGYTIRLE